MRKPSKTIPALAALLISALPSIAQADCKHASGGICRGLVEHIWMQTTEGDSYVLIDMEGADTTGLTCDREPEGRLAGVYVQLNLTTDSMRAAFSAVLASYLAGKPIEIRTNTDPTQCTAAAVVLPRF